MSELFDTRTTGKTIKGTESADGLQGTKYADRIFGYGGNDWLIGNSGDDLLIGGAGADKIQGDAGNDTASYAGATSGVTASLYTQTGSTGDAAGDTFTQIENLTGTAFNDVLIGYYDPNILKGGAGDDKLYGREADDSLYVGTGIDFADGGDGNDLVSWLGSARGVTVDLADASNNAGEAAGDTYINVENLGGTNAKDVLYGTAVRNTFYGYRGDDTIDGRAGSDILIGGPGADTLTGGTSRDLFRMMDPSEGPDRILDFQRGDNDELSFNAKGFGGGLVTGDLPASALVKGVNPTPSSTASVFLYDSGTGQLYFDVDGTGSAPKVELLTLVGIPDIQATDISMF